jgi:hypothetical protein
VVVGVSFFKRENNNVTWGLVWDIYLTDWLRSWWLHASRVQRSRCCQELEGTFVRFHFKIVALLTKNPKNLTRGEEELMVLLPFRRRDEESCCPRSFRRGTEVRRLLRSFRLGLSPWWGAAVGHGSGHWGP